MTRGHQTRTPGVAFVDPTVWTHLRLARARRGRSTCILGAPRRAPVTPLGGRAKAAVLPPRAAGRWWGGEGEAARIAAGLRLIWPSFANAPCLPCLAAQHAPRRSRRGGRSGSANPCLPAARTAFPICLFALLHSMHPDAADGAEDAEMAQAATPAAEVPEADAGEEEDEVRSDVMLSVVWQRRAHSARLGAAWYVHAARARARAARAGPPAELRRGRRVGRMHRMLPPTPMSPVIPARPLLDNRGRNSRARACACRRQARR